MEASSSTKKTFVPFGISFNATTLKVLGIIFKVLGVLLGLVYLWATLSNPYIEISIFTLYEVAPNKVGRVILEIIKFITNASILIAMVAPFFSFRSTSKIVRYFNPVVIVLNLIFQSDLIYSLVGPSGDNSFLKIQQFYVQLVLLILISVFAWVMFLFDGHEKQNKKDINRTCFLALVIYFFTSLINLPFSFLLGLFGPSMAAPKDFSFCHRLLLYSTFGLPLIFTIALRKLNYTKKWYICIQLALSAFYCFFRRYTFISFKDVTQIPLHLCNAGVVIILIAMIFKFKPAFYFGYLINILGACFAIAMPDKTGDMFYFDSLNYWHNHMADIGIPLLALGLGVFPRPKLKYVLYALLGFSVYYLIVTYMDAKYYYKGVDFFFLNSDKYSSAAPLFEHWRSDFNLVINTKNGTLVYKWLYWLIVYVCYCALTFVMWFVYSQFYRISDRHMDCDRKNRIKRELKKAKIKQLEEVKGEQ